MSEQDTLAKPRPNVLVLMSDQHSKRQLGCYGDSLVRTPNLDRLASQGMLFENAYTAGPLCVPSRTAFMTGRRPTANRVWSNNHVLSSGIPTWAHALGAAGYETALIGRMHFIGPDQRHGFERRPLGEYMAHHPGAEMQGAPMFRDIPRDTTGQFRVAVEMAGVGTTTYHAFDEMVTDHTIEYLHEKSSDPDGRPFAAAAGFLLPHCPYFAPQELFDYYYERVDVPQPTEEQLQGEPEAIKHFKKVRGIEEPLTFEQIRVARAAYYGMCEYIDGLIGRILDTLDDTGLSENTLVVYTTDHGEMAGQHGCWWKSNYYEESVGVPLIARLPGVVPAGARNTDLCSLMDIAPTLTDMAGAEPLPAGDGHSLAKLLSGEQDESRPQETFSEFVSSPRDDRLIDPPSRMIRSGPWKLYQYLGHAHPVLYNLDNDPHEMRDLGADLSTSRYGRIYWNGSTTVGTLRPCSGRSKLSTTT